MQAIPEKYSSKTILCWLLLGSTALRLLAAAATSLGNDEVYYFTYAVQPDWNHFDHPPLVGIFIRLFTFNLNLNQEVFVRLPAIAGAALSTLFMYQCGKLLATERAGLFAALLYNICFYTTLISGTFILPDSVQLPFWLLALQAAIRISQEENKARLRRQMLLFGLFAGLAILCKVHGIFLWVGLGGYVVFFKRSLLKEPVLYLALLLTCCFITPIIFWNFKNDFITYRFHSERVEYQDKLDFASFFATLGGQIAYFNPVLFVLAAIGSVYVFRNHTRYNAGKVWLLLWFALPIIACTTSVAIFRKTLPHWSGPGFLGILLLTAIYLDLKILEGKSLAGRLLKAATILTIAIFPIGLALINLYPGSLSDKPFPETGKYDFTLDMFDWKALQPAFEQIRNADIQSGKISGNAPLLVHKWFPGAHVYYYVAFPTQMQLRGAGKLEDLHKFVWMNALSSPIPKGGSAYYITPSNTFTEPETAFSGLFEKWEKAAQIPQLRGGKIVRYWFVYRLKNAKTKI